MSDWRRAGGRESGVVLQPVIEIPKERRDTVAWPVASRAAVGAASEAYAWLNLTGTMPPDRIALTVAEIVQYNNVSTDGGAEETIRRLLAREDLIILGGLLVHDVVTGVRIEPSCCCGLEDWRDWTRVLSASPALGHDPSPWVEVGSAQLRVWEDEINGDANDVPHVDIDRAALPALLHAAQQDMISYLAAVRAWIADIAPGQADALVRKLDASFAITDPIDQAAPA
jgi:hypothetical protein